MKKIAAISAVSLVALSLSACVGDTQGERAVTGAAIGAGAGALGGAAGAAIGATSGDRDRDYDRRDDRRDRRAYRDRDGDGVSDYYDRAPRNPYRD